MTSKQQPFQFPAFGAGLRNAWRAGYGLSQLRRDLLAGLTVGIVAIPLAMALAIATGVPPQHGLYTAIIAGAVIAIAGGSRFNISGPTAAFVVILFPIVQQHGVGGLLIATLMAGMILIALGFMRMGQLIRYVPYPVIVGFTAGIAVVIATLQIPGFLGLTMPSMGEHYVENVWHIAEALDTIRLQEVAIGAFTLAVLLLWPRLKIGIPAPLVALALAAAVGWVVNLYLDEASIRTIASSFTWTIGERSGQGIPPVPPSFMLPWNLPGPNGEPLQVNLGLIRQLIGPAIAIAILGAIESLLCASVADGMTNTRHDPNSELVGQGIGNLITPLFGGITATAAIARTATNIRSGAVSPLSAVFHALAVLLAVVSLAGLLGLVPMAALAALLFVVAWNMSEVRHFVHTLRSAPGGDVAVLLTCFLLTVIFDMVIAVGVGIGLAAALFIRRMAQITNARRITPAEARLREDLPPQVALFDMNGPLFFGAAEKAVDTLHLVDSSIQVIIVDMHDVTSMDATALVAVETMLGHMRRRGIGLIFVDLQPRMITKLRRAGIRKTRGELMYSSNLESAVRTAERWLAEKAGQPSHTAKQDRASA
ncbi:putative sulfate transporter YchM [Thioalkalivibrio sulfidiphilus HL-EbGr7]|uniref:Putative sulfate transporter YchM n=1 Tax=Thioalkalivibrio sulfidiphilus (strain HL-EbGR7) TaxID=396588 RepID=B8GLV1_THISH|nr:C4-dicarboxylic acid transporter DauA [Thioalkalivibrio sulfidiphilus]ACL71704.1 putative sulfate transporter YchM [Thioalkalivibrio sulfidiphilus HL-EbGr7]